MEHHGHHLHCLIYIYNYEMLSIKEKKPKLNTQSNLSKQNYLPGN